MGSNWPDIFPVRLINTYPPWYMQKYKPTPTPIKSVHISNIGGIVNTKLLQLIVQTCSMLIKKVFGLNIFYLLKYTIGHAVKWIRCSKIGLCSSAEQTCVL